MSEPRKPSFRTNRSGGGSGGARGSSGGRSRPGFGAAPRPERFQPPVGGESSTQELLEMADSLTRQARELTNHASVLRRMAAEQQEGGERPRPAAPARSTGPARPGRPAARPEGRGGFGGERGERGSFEPRAGGAPRRPGDGERSRGGPRSRPGEDSRPRGGEERPRKRSGEAPSWAPKKGKK